MFGSKEKQTDLQAFVVHDSKSGVWDLPSYAINAADCIRRFQNILIKPEAKQDQIVTNSEDFKIFKIGDYDRKTGTFNYHHPEHVANMFELKASMDQQKQ